ncbi:MAG: hypothetical protein JSW34_12175 [Candidatus Zixiibacteriota bacterium]|nr:MAG: hypothetical protein JSW34_12175 [candidate division Zixibacteria bacterium]
MRLKSKKDLSKRAFFSGCISALMLVLVLGSCTAQRQLRKEGAYKCDNDTRDIPEPGTRKPKLYWDSIERTLFNQGEQLLDMERNFRKLFGRPEQARNINSLDEVPDCCWFTNRHGFDRMSPEQIARGRVVTGGPDTSGVWTVFRPKVGGATPGFWIKDKHGHQYMMKFDPPGYPEMATAASAISCRYFYACGYNVPEETIVYWKPEILKVQEGVTYTDDDGREQPFTQEHLLSILKDVHQTPDGYIRSLASLSLGNVKGPFSFDGTRRDDPNDWCPHQHRRELRALYVMASLVNHHDTKDMNTMDTYEEKDGRRFLKHHLLDFGSTLGSDGDAPKPPLKGYANVFDLRDVMVSLFTLGTKTWPWEYAKPVEYPSIGYFESEIFEPDKFNPIIPNPAFEEMTDRDAYWGAKIVMSFRDADLKALVKAGQYSNPEAEAFLLKTLIERRDKIGRHWFGKVNPLDNFEIRDAGASLEISFDDLAVAYGLEDARHATYELSIRYDGEEIIAGRTSPETGFALSEADLDLMKSRYLTPRADDDYERHAFEVRIRTRRGGGSWSRPTALWLWYTAEDQSLALAGLEHLDVTK